MQTGIALLGLPVMLALAALASAPYGPGPEPREWNSACALTGLNRRGRPLFRRLLVGLGGVLIGRSRKELNRRLAMAGRPGDLTAEAFIGLKIMVALLSAVVAVVASLALAGGAMSVILGAAITLLGFRIPNI